MVQETAILGGTASDITVARIARAYHKLMTWVPTPVPDETCFESIKAGIDALPAGTKALLNSGEFYGNNPPEANLELLARFFEKYPAYAGRVFLSVKGGTILGQHKPDSSPQNLRRSIENTNRILRGTKRLDLFECARVDPTYPIEETVAHLKDLIKEGLFDHLGLSECSAQTVRRANMVHPVALVEIEVSPWSYEKETRDVIHTCKELGIAIAAYSPLGRGAFTGKISKFEDIPEGDMRRHFSRFQEQNFNHNIALVDALKNIAAKKGCTPAQLSIAWVCSRGDHVIPIPGSSRKERTLENLQAGGMTLSPEEVSEIDRIVERFEVKGGRYLDDTPLLWG